MRNAWFCTGFLIALSTAGACGGKKSDGLPPATEWNATTANVGMVEIPKGPAANPRGGGMAADPNDPHAGLGLDMPNGGNPAADPNDPHSGLDMSGGGGPAMGGDPANPHAGQDMSKLGLPPPDPNRPIDPKHRIAGIIKVDPKIKASLTRGTAVFLIAKHLDASGAPSGPPVAVEKLTWDKDEIPFELTDHDSMIAGTVLDGDVVVIAHYDTDGDAISKTQGDILGQVRVTIPADKVTLVLDNQIQ